jgi:hypothetical protein
MVALFGCSTLAIKGFITFKIMTVYNKSHTTTLSSGLGSKKSLLWWFQEYVFLDLELVVEAIRSRFETGNRLP